MHTILLVDDRPDNLKAYKRDLEHELHDAEVLTARTEGDAIRLINERSVDVVISDLMMDDHQSGMRVLAAAKAKDALTMVILITAYEEKLERERAFAIGAFDCLTKGSVGIKTGHELVYKTKSALFARLAAKQLVESEQQVSGLKRYFDPIVFDRIRTNPELLAPGRRTVTLAFWDIRGFSAMCVLLQEFPETITGFLRDYFEEASRVVFNHGGVLDKFMGDGVMALFGAMAMDGKSDEDFALDALNAATELRAAFEAVHKKWERVWMKQIPTDVHIGLGCGIHTGPVVVGNMGTAKRDHFTAVGPHVNFASRIESSSKGGEIRFSQTTKAHVDDRVKSRKLEVLSNIKNIKGDFGIYGLEN